MATTIIPPAPHDVIHSCLHCRMFLATEVSPFCSVCEDIRDDEREDISRRIREWESKFLTSFEIDSSVDEFIEVADGEFECYDTVRSPEPEPKSGVRSGDTIPVPYSW